jgi:hypothetical protein
MQHAALIERGHDCQLRRQQCRAIEIEIATSQVGKGLSKIGGGVARLKIGRGKVAQDRVVAREVRIIERQQGRANEIQRLLDAHRHGLLLRSRARRRRRRFWGSGMARLRPSGLLLSRCVP